MCSNNTFKIIVISKSMTYKVNTPQYLIQFYIIINFLLKD